MNTTSVLGGAFLLVVGIGFLASALIGWSRRADTERTRRTTSIVIDVLVGSVAVVDAWLSILDEPNRTALWWCGSGVLALSLTLLVGHLRRTDRARAE